MEIENINPAYIPINIPLPHDKPESSHSIYIYSILELIIYDF